MKKVDIKETVFSRRFRRLFAGCMAVASAMCVLIFPVSGFLPLDENVVDRAEEKKKDEIEALRMEGTIPGDVYDRNGEMLISCTADGENQYRDDSAYTMTVGFLEEAGSGYLMKRMRSDLLYADQDNKKGRSLVLTLDAGLQELLWRQISQGEGERGSIAVLDAVTGEILGLAYAPSFSVSELRTAVSEQDEEEKTGWEELMLDGQQKLLFQLQNPTRPGSIFKIVTGIGILENGLENVLIDDGGSSVDNYGEFEVNNNMENAYGALDFQDAFVYSSNIYFARMAYDYLGWNEMEELAQRCHIGGRISCDFGLLYSTFESGVQPYDMSKPNEMLARTGYGYADLQMNVVQAAMLAQGVANDGVMCRPYMVQSVHETDGYLVDKDTWEYRLGDEVESRSGYETREKYQIMNAQTADAIGDAMEAAYRNVQATLGLSDTSQEGISADGETWSVALKTGTADLTENGTENNLWIVSYAPADQPRYVVAVNRYCVDSQHGADLFRDLTPVYEYLIRNS